MNQIQPVWTQFYTISQMLDDRIVKIIIIEGYIMVLIMILSFNGKISWYFLVQDEIGIISPT